MMCRVDLILLMFSFGNSISIVVDIFRMGNNYIGRVTGADWLQNLMW